MGIQAKDGVRPSLLTRTSSREPRQKAESRATFCDENPALESSGVTPRLVSLRRLAGLHDEVLNRPGLGAAEL